MHHDEGNQALKFGRLLETGDYRYDPADHHGPTLYYATLPVARAAGRSTLASLDETILRLVPALFGAGTLLLFLLLSGGMTRAAIALAAVFAALSPASVYYERFYIQESLLVFFLAGLLGSGWRWVRTKKAGWAAAAGAFAGLMFATKETSIILFAAVAAGVAGAAILEKRSSRRAAAEEEGPAGPAVKAGSVVLHAAIAAATAAVVIVVFYSSFFRHPEGVAAAVRSIGGYLAKGGAGGAHAHPWWYYLRILAYWKDGAGPAWSEAFVQALALAGAFAALGAPSGRGGNRAFARFLAISTATSLVVFSAIPYKTPWNLLPFHLGILLMAGIGAGFIWNALRFRLYKAVALALLLPGIVNLAAQCRAANFVYDSDPRNPYAYAQTGRDYLRLVGRVEDIARLSPGGRSLLVGVVAPPDETWPLPWSLRTFPNVGYWTDPAGAKDLGAASVVVASAGFEDAVAGTLGERFAVEHFGLRPEVPLAVFIRRDLWERFLEGRRGPGAPADGGPGR